MPCPPSLANERLLDGATAPLHKDFELQATQNKALAGARAEFEFPVDPDLLLCWFGLSVLPAETLHATCRIYQLLFAGEKRMAVGADFYADVALMG